MEQNKKSAKLNGHSIFADFLRILSRCTVFNFLFESELANSRHYFAQCFARFFAQLPEKREKQA
jgi:hypothetical protein